MKRNKRKDTVSLLLLILLGISIGFAALATTLKINGNASITKNTWNIYWDRIGDEDGVTPAEGDETIITDESATIKKNIVTWKVTFDTPGDFYEFQVDAVNGGTIDAEIIGIEKKYDGNVISQDHPLPAYLKYEITYADNNNAPALGDKLLKRDDSTTPFTPTRRRYKIRVEYDRDAVTNEDVNTQSGKVTHTFSLAVNYGQSSPEIIPTVDTCPDCLFGFYTYGAYCDFPADNPTTYDIGDVLPLELATNGPGATSNYFGGLTRDYRKLKMEFNQGNESVNYYKNYCSEDADTCRIISFTPSIFLGYKVDNNRIIQKIYECFIHENQPYCYDTEASNDSAIREVFGEYDPITGYGCENNGPCTDGVVSYYNGHFTMYYDFGSDTSLLYIDISQDCGANHDDVCLEGPKYSDKQ